MPTPHSFHDIHKRAKELVEEGIEFLRTGFQGAEVVAGKTVEATKLHYRTKRWQVDLYRTLHDLGKLVYESAATKDEKSIEVTPAIAELIGRIHTLQHDIVAAESGIADATIVTPTPHKGKKNTHE